MGILLTVPGVLSASAMWQSVQVIVETEYSGPRCVAMHLAAAVIVTKRSGMVGIGVCGVNAHYSTEYKYSFAFQCFSSNDSLTRLAQ